MCRIVGFRDFSFRGEYDASRVLEDMRDTLAFGGPDDAGSYFDTSHGVALGHRRLSIIDLSSLGHQPMSSRGGKLWITYNGEVYNYREVQTELRQKGMSFVSSSDTEVILKAYEAWGFDCLHKFRGMWAFALWDTNTEELVLCRDRLGVKPLYCYLKDSLFMFSSELKAFLRHPKFSKELDASAVALYLQFGYVPGRNSIFRHTFKVEPGQCIVVNKHGALRTLKYWEPATFFRKGVQRRSEWLKKPESEVVDELESRMQESFKLRLVADVEVGIFLSGGTDSSLVCSMLQKELTRPLKTFTIGFREKEYNEAERAREVAAYLGTEHTEMYCSPAEAAEIIPLLPQIYDEPFADSSAIPTYLLSRLARRDVKVALSGDGGDEQFFGYSRYAQLSSIWKKAGGRVMRGFFGKTAAILSPQWAEKLYRKLKFGLPEIVRFQDAYLKLAAFLSARSPAEAYDIAMQRFLEKDLSALGIEAVDQEHSDFPGDAGSLMMFLDLCTYLPCDILTKVDRASMHVSLEAREPLLDNTIVEFSSELPIEYKFKDGAPKYLLRKVLAKYLPGHLVHSDKHGFDLPVYEWLKKDLKGLYLEYLSAESVRKGGMFNEKEVTRLVSEYFRTGGRHSDKLWTLFMFELWRREWA